MHDAQLVGVVPAVGYQARSGWYPHDAKLFAPESFRHPANEQQPVKRTLVSGKHPVGLTNSQVLTQFADFTSTTACDGIN